MVNYCVIVSHLYLLQLELMEPQGRGIVAIGVVRGIIESAARQECSSGQKEAREKSHIHRNASTVSPASGPVTVVVTMPHSLAQIPAHGRRT